MKRAVFINPYYGHWPDFFLANLKTCGFNPSIDWLIITDLPPITKVPVNVHFHHMELSELKATLEKMLDIKVNININNKICDFRPAFGHIFAPLLTKYDYWGHTDLDILYGNIEKYIIPPMDEGYDVISLAQFSTGHCQLFKNTNAVNYFYQNIDGVKEALSGPHCGFDETPVTRYLCQSDLRWWRIENGEAEMKKNECAIGANILRYGQVYGERLTGGEVFWWENGRVFQEKSGRRREFGYLHLLGLKYNRRWQNKTPLWSSINDVPDKFYVTPYGLKSVSEFAQIKIWHKIICLIEGIYFQFRELIFR